MTTPDFEHWVPRALAPSGETYWRIVALVKRSPWYLLTSKHSEGTLETMAVAWESTLKEVVEAIGNLTIVDLHCISPSGDGFGEWQLKKISEVWLPAEDEVLETGPLLFAVVGENDLYDSHLSKIKLRREHHKIFLRLAVAP